MHNFKAKDKYHRYANIFKENIMFGIKPIYWVLINSSVAFVYLFIISKILGKKQIAQLEFIDYAIGISLGSIAAEMATNSDKPFYFYLIAMSIFFALAFLVAILGRKCTFLKSWLKGKTATLIYECILYTSPSPRERG